ncbi:MAG: hypothetical protein AAF478_12430 [Pseudomonadota bacterium]
MRRLPALSTLFFLASFPVLAGEVDVLDVQISGSGTDYRFSVTVEHADTGWDHYADGWEVLGEGGKVYGKRVLAHPHVDEQPFTRSGRITIPEGVKFVIVRANDSVHGTGGREMKVAVPGR